MARSSITVEQLGKKFSVTLRDALKYGMADSLRRLVGLGKDQESRPGEFWALNDVNFSLEPGQALGIMGVNGSGKTTLLRVLNGTYGPDTGKVTLRGKVGALIAAGAGFSPMLTGRENVYVSGSLLGMTTAEIRKRFDEIVNFAELEEFVDMPVRNYSSGMAVRLGFAVAVLGAPEILLVDEVLAVGDMSFQKKCYERIYAMKNRGTTILLVSHSPGAIWAVCDLGLILDHGRTQGLVPVEDACRRYDDLNALARVERTANTLSPTYGGTRGGTGEIVIERLEVLNRNHEQTNVFDYGESFTIRIHIISNKKADNVLVRVQIDAEINKAICIIDNYEQHGTLIKFEVDSYVVDIKVEKPNLRPGVYTFSPSITLQNEGVHTYFEYNMASVSVLSSNGSGCFFYAEPRASVHLDCSYSAERCQVQE